MHLDLTLALAGLIVGFVIGLTGVGGGALLTPVLIIFFGISAPAAVSSDIVASLVLKPIGGAVHWRRGTVNLKLVGWLALGAIPGALGGVYVLTHVLGANVDNFIKTSLGWILLVAAAAIVLKAVLQTRRRVVVAEPGTIVLHPARSAAIGLVGGFIVGLTSVGSGSLMIVLLMILYPRISMRELIGTDLVQAIPLVGSAALGITLWGHLQFSLIGSLLLGAIPAVWLGAHFSSKAPDHYIRPVLVLAMSFSALKLLGLSNRALGDLAIIGAILTVGTLVTMRVRARQTAATEASSPELATTT
jgi:uncharacterized membrane protein YfcA